MIKSIVISGVVGAALMSFTASAEAGFTHRHRLIRDIEVLHEKVECFAREARYQAGFSHLTIEAGDLLHEVDYFCAIAKRSCDDHYRLKRDFQRVAREMQHVQLVFERACRYRNDPRLVSSWAEVECAFDRVYFDLYECHCDFLRHHAEVEVHHHGHHHDRFDDRLHGDRRVEHPRFRDPRLGDSRFSDPRFGDSRFSDPRFGDYRQPSPGFGQPGGVQIDFRGNGPAPIWAQILQQALR